jgi:phage shock protein PspC (stress-responsive transcriptional regulator)
MERVVTVNLNGNSFQLEEQAYEALKSYLDRAGTVLAANPDRTDILQDLEQAIAEKVGGCLSPHKTVVTQADMTRVLDEMGPVMGEEEARPADAEAPGEAPPKRLYRLQDQAWIGGVCMGISAYLNIEVTLVRLAAIILGVITGGWALLLYILAIFIIPTAQTSAERAAAHGVAFNSQKIIEQAEREYRSVADNVSGSWRKSQRAFRRAQRRHARNDWDGTPSPAPLQPPPGYLTRILSGLAGFVLSLISAALLIALLLSLFALTKSESLFGWSPPADIPLWLSIVILLVVYSAVETPVSHLRRLCYAAASGSRLTAGLSDGILSFILILLCGGLAYQFIPEFREGLQALPDMIRTLIDRLDDL